MRKEDTDKIKKENDGGEGGDGGISLDDRNPFPFFPLPFAHSFMILSKWQVRSALDAQASRGYVRNVPQPTVTPNTLLFSPCV